MNVLTAMKVFIAVAEHQSFTTASRTLNISATATSRYIQDFEDWCGVQLFVRTTRKISITQEGESQLTKCKLIVEEVRTLKNQFTQDDPEPIGRVRLTAPPVISKCLLTDILRKYLDKYPKVEIDLLSVNRNVELVAEGYDLAIRIGDLADSTLRARKLSEVKLILVASPDYISKFGQPKNLKEMKNHNCIIDTTPEFNERWPLADQSLKKNFRAKGNFSVNSGEIAEDLVLNGFGITLLPDFYVLKHIAEGRLIRILSEIESPTLGMYLVYPQSRHENQNTRTLIDFILKQYV